MYCKKCGASIDDDARFCAACGASQEGTESQKTKPSERWESKAVRVAPLEEEETIEYYERFGWELLSSQTIDTKNSHLERQNGDLYSVTESKNYVKLTFRRNKNMPHYEEIVDLEEELNDLESDRNTDWDIEEEYREYKQANPRWGWGKTIGIGFLIYVCCMWIPMGWGEFESTGNPLTIIGIIGLIGLAFLIFKHTKKVNKYEQDHSRWKAKRKELKAKAIEVYSKKKAEIYEKAEALLAGK